MELLATGRGDGVWPLHLQRGTGRTDSREVPPSSQPPGFSCRPTAQTLLPFAVGGPASPPPPPHRSFVSCPSFRSPQVRGSGPLSDRPSGSRPPHFHLLAPTSLVWVPLFSRRLLRAAPRRLFQAAVSAEALAIRGTAVSLFALAKEAVFLPAFPACAQRMGIQKASPSVGPIARVC